MKYGCRAIYFLRGFKIIESLFDQKINNSSVFQFGYVFHTFYWAYQSERRWIKNTRKVTSRP